LVCFLVVPFCAFFAFVSPSSKKKREKFAGEGKMWDLASPKSLSLQTVSRLLFFFVGS
jgi:hypothetical protein